MRTRRPRRADASALTGSSTESMCIRQWVPMPKVGERARPSLDLYQRPGIGSRAPMAITAPRPILNFADHWLKGSLSPRRLLGRVRNADPRLALGNDPSVRDDPFRVLTFTSIIARCKQGSRQMPAFICTA